MNIILFLSLISSGFGQERPFEYSQQVRKIVQKSACAGCHTENLPTTNEQALGVFNLSKDNWNQGMSLPQLERLVWSLTGASPEEISAMAGSDVDLRPLKPHEKVILNEFMEMEKRKREQSPIYDIINF